jgi:hypothetical protein
LLPSSSCSTTQPPSTAAGGEPGLVMVVACCTSLHNIPPPIGQAFTHQLEAATPDRNFHAAVLREALNPWLVCSDSPRVQECEAAGGHGKEGRQSQDGLTEVRSWEAGPVVSS